MSLSRLIQEARRLVEHEQIIILRGGKLFIRDDEGNEDYFGPNGTAGYRLQYDGQTMEYEGGGGGSYGGGYGKSYPTMSPQAKSARLAFLDDVLALRPNSFLKSIRDQINSRSSLSSKQRNAAYNVLKSLLEPDGLDAWTASGEGRYQKGSVQMKGAKPKPPAALAAPKTATAAGQDELLDVIRKAVQKRGDSFLSTVLQSMEGEKNWRAGAAEETLKKIRHELYKRGMKKEADLFR
jgi:hypothetical protein